MGGFSQDMRYAMRALSRRPGFAAVVVLTLAIGIGANTAIYGVARDVLLRPFPYPDADRVVAIEDFRTDGVFRSGSVTYPNIHDLDQAASTFTDIGATRWWTPALEREDGSVVLNGATVTGNYFAILGVEAGLGRLFRPDEAGPGRPDQVVLSHGLWSDRFGADPDVVGTDIRLSGSSFRVIGVMSDEFEDPWLLGGPGSEPDVWQTVASPPSEWPRSGRSWRGIGRVGPDVSVEAAQDELDVLFAGLVEAYPEHNAEHRVRITPLRSVIAGPARPVLFALLGSVGLLLLVACANLANLLLGRALDRRDEMAVHRALGAPGWRIFNRSLAEAGTLAAIGGLAGVGVAAWLGSLTPRLAPLLPRPVTGGIDAGVLGFALVVTAASGILFGLAPALHSARSGDALPGGAGGRGGTLGRRGNRLRRSLVVAELAITTSLLVGAALLVRSFERLGAVDLGLQTAGVVSVGLHGSAWWDLDPAAAQAQWDEVLAAVRAIPGVEAAGAIDYVPLDGNYSCDGTRREDLPEPLPGEGECAEVRVVLPGALDAMGVSLVRGRMLEPRDGPDAPGAVVIDENMAAAFWPGAGEDPIGSRLFVHQRTHEVVGIVSNMRHFGPDGATRPMLYLHAPQEGWNGIARGLSLMVRGADAAALVEPIRRSVASVNGSIAIGSVETIESLLGRNLAGPRFRTLIIAAFAVTALLLAVLGIAGVMSYSVNRRRRELGVRLALGARPEEVRGLVLTEGARLVVAGIGAGLLSALVLSAAVAQTLDALLFEVSVRDPVAYALVTVVLAAVATAACWGPARHASRVDPIAALSSD